MRSSVGATWIFSICLTFIMLFVAYLTISLNYSKAFRVKNYIVSKIEESEGYIDTMESDIEDYLIYQGYQGYGNCAPTIEADEQDDWYLITDGDLRLSDDIPVGMSSACIYRSDNISDSDGPDAAIRTKYRVIAFFKFDIPVIGHFMSFQVGGETRYFYDFSNS